MAEREPVVLFITVPSAEVASTLGRVLVEEHLAACVNVVPGLRSLYWWEGAVHDDPELLLIVKTCRDRVPQLQERVLALHPYTVPELVVLPIVDGSARYLEWVRASTI